MTLACSYSIAGFGYLVQKRKNVLRNSWRIAVLVRPHEFYEILDEITEPEIGFIHHVDGQLHESLVVSPGAYEVSRNSDPFPLVEFAIDGRQFNR